MRKCFIHNQNIDSVFQLLGEKENDLTYSLGWALSQSDALFEGFIKYFANSRIVDAEAEIYLQKYDGKGGGFTDIEIITNGCHFIVEAKRGWSLPSPEQLAKYQSRLRTCRGEAVLITLSECSNDYFKYYFDESAIEFKVIHMPWKDLHQIAEKAKVAENHAGKRLLNQFTTYLERIMTIQNKESNWVYVVSVGSGTPEGWNISWRGIVENKLKYFHPIAGNGWPTTPPNYIAFRYDGKLQSIHHIEKYIVTEFLHNEIREMPNKQWSPHFVYTLGDAIKPPNRVGVGKIFKNGRVWCMLDTLLTSKTISKARDISAKRVKEALI